jgi:glycosyltransferase involved in cell wall biosynthesis
MVVYGDIAHDSRVQREANSLAQAGHSVVIFCLEASSYGMSELDDAVEVVVRAPERGIVPGSPRRSAGTSSRSPLRVVAERVSWFWGYARNLYTWGRAITRPSGSFDIWHAHDLSGLMAVAQSIPDEARLVYDVHDLFLDAGTAADLPSPARWALRRYEQHLVRRVDATICVNNGLARVFERRYRPRSLTVVHNCPPRWTPPNMRPDLIREATGIPPGAPIVLYHGLLGANRGVERLIEAMHEPGLEDAHLVFMGYGELVDPLRDRVSEPRYGGRVHVLDPVPPLDLLPWVASADVGAIALPGVTANIYLSTPNKLFECLSAGTPVVVSDFPAMREIVLDDPAGPLGVACDPSDVGDIARALRELVGVDGPDREDLRRRCLAASHERWNWESEVARLVAVYDRLAPRRMVS